MPSPVWRWFRWATGNGGPLAFIQPAPDAGQSTFTYSAFANTANGVTTTTLTFTAKDANGTAMPAAPLTWSVERITLDAADSVLLSVDPSDIAADGVESAAIDVQVRHELDGEYVNLRGVPGANVVLAVSGTNNTITQPSAVTDYQGVTSGSVVTTQAAATKTVSQTVLGVAMDRTATLTTDAGAPPASQTIFDTRSGQANDIQVAASFAAAESASGLNAIEKNYLDPAWGPWGWDTSFDGAGKHAFVLEVLQNSGYSSCVGGSTSMQSFQIERYLSGIGANGVVLHIEYKTRLGRHSSASGSRGAVDSYLDGGKKLVLFRYPSSYGNEGRLTAAGGQQGYQSLIIGSGPITGEPDSGTAQDPRSANNSDIRNSPGLLSPSEGTFTDWSDYAGEIVTIKYEIKTETTVGAGDGYFKWYIDAIAMLNLENLYTGTLGWGWMQLGGPTWVCPPQDQTVYIYDLRCWTVG